MHIVFLSDAIDNQHAGVHFYISNLIESLTKIDQKNTYSFIHQRENLFFDKLKNYIIPTRKSLGYETFRKLHLIPRLLKKIKADVVIEPCHIGPFRMPKGTKKVTIIYDITPILFPEFHTKVSVITHKLLLGKSIQDADLLLVPSQNTKNDILSKYKTTAKITITSCGAPIYKDTNKKITHEKKSTLDSIRTPYILFIGTIEPRKNLSTLIDAFLELKKSHNIPHTLILGGGLGWKNTKTIEKARNSKDVVLTEYLNEEEKKYLYEHADMFVYPSIYEGFGLPPLEAMSYGVPVICSNGGSLKEIFGNHALLFKPLEKEKLKEHIMTLIHDSKLRERLIAKGKEYAKTFTWQRTAKIVMEALNRLEKKN